VGDVLVAESDLETLFVGGADAVVQQLDGDALGPLGPVELAVADAGDEIGIGVGLEKPRLDARVVDGDADRANGDDQRRDGSGPLQPARQGSGAVIPLPLTGAGLRVGLVLVGMSDYR